MVDTDSLNFRFLLAAIPFYVTGFIGNVLVIRIVHKTRHMHSTTNYLLANLAVSDAITISLAPLYFFTHLVGISTTGSGEFACKFIILSEISIAASAFTLTVLAIERYHALLKPFRAGMRLTEENIKQAVAVIWISSVLLAFPEYFLQAWSESQSKCIGPWNLPLNQRAKVYVIIFCISSCYIPAAVFLFCYGSLINGLYFSHTICATDTNEDRGPEKRKLVITFILATLGFVIGYGPLAVFYTVLVSGADEQIDFKLFSILWVVFLLNLYCSLCLNPILYAFRSTSFKEGFKRTIFCRGPPPDNRIVQLT